VKERERVLECLRSAHDHRVSTVEDNVLMRPCNLGVYDRYFAVIFTGYHLAVDRVDRVDRVDAAFPSYDAERELGACAFVDTNWNIFHADS
jgi:hypothetical protein